MTNRKVVLALFALESIFAPALSAQPLSWQQTGTSLTLLHGTTVVWQIVADPAQGKPYFHPLATPDGTVLTDLRPADHIWHRGLWWSWKTINDLNYWEEDQTHRSQAATELAGYKLQPHPNGSAELTFSIKYHPWDAPPILTEQRTVEVSAPANGSYEIDWTSDFTAVTPVTLGRTPVPGEPNSAPWGGYAGLSLRLNPATKKWTFTNSEGASGVAALHGKPARWVKFSAGPGLPAVTIFDNPKNVGYPSLWYINQDMPYFSPALLFAKPMTLAAGQKLLLRYRIFITDHDIPAPPPPGTK